MLGLRPLSFGSEELRLPLIGYGAGMFRVHLAGTQTKTKQSTGVRCYAHKSRATEPLAQ
jgi:hypothetical protein